MRSIEFDSNLRMSGWFISQFEESIHEGMNLTPTQKFILLSGLKREARKEISNLKVNDENYYPLAMENFYKP